MTPLILEPLGFSMLMGLVGLLIGSFLNVCISRLPQDYSIVLPRSHCPRCGAWIAWYDNIPLVSYLILAGKCRVCKAPISWRYPLVEALTGFFFYSAIEMHGITWAGAKWCVFSAILITLIFSDIETHILPDEFTLTGVVAGILLAPIVPLPASIPSFLYPNASRELISFLDAVFAAVLLAGGLWLMGYIFERLRKKEGLGLGDVKMLAFLGAFLGLESTLLVLILASFFGSLLGLLWVKLRGEDIGSYELPFGAFLGAAGLIVAFAGAPLLRVAF